jgi:hypothetical protein
VNFQCGAIAVDALVSAIRKCDRKLESEAGVTGRISPSLAK